MEDQDKKYIKLFERMWLIRAFEDYRQDFSFKIRVSVLNQ